MEAISYFRDTKALCYLLERNVLRPLLTGQFLIGTNIAPAYSYLAGVGISAAVEKITGMQNRRL